MESEQSCDKGLNPWGLPSPHEGLQIFWSLWCGSG